jgi:hypothetical protein
MIKTLDVAVYMLPGGRPLPRWGGARMDREFTMASPGAGGVRSEGGGNG